MNVELKAIANLTDINSVKIKRASRRRQLTRLKTRYERLTNDSALCDIPLDDLAEIHQLCKDNVSLHRALQTRYDEMSDPTGVASSEREEELLKDDEVLEAHSRLLRSVQRYYKAKTVINQGTALQESLTSLSEVENLSTSTVAAEIKDISTQVTALREQTVDFKDIPPVNVAMTSLRKQLQDLFVRMSSEHSVKTEKPHPAETTSPASSISSSIAKLQLDLPKFSGLATDWHNFYALFSAAMKTRGAGLSDPERCCFLLKSMSSSEAEKIVQYYQSGADGYDTAIRALQDAYGHPHLVYPLHLRKLCQPTTTYTYSRSSLRHMREKWETNTRGLERAGGNTYNQLLAAMLMEEWDDKLRHEWTSRYNEPDRLPDLDEVLDFFRKREFNLPDDTNTGRVGISKATRPSSSSSARSKPQTSLKVNASVISCPVCSAPHGLARCSQFLSFSADKKNQVVKDSKRCLNCLSPAHLTPNCTSAFNCRECNKRHHTLIHRDSPGTPTNTTADASVSSAFVSSATSAESSITTLCPGLLSTAVVDVMHGRRRQRTRLAFDGGSSVSLMTERLASALRLKRHSQEMELDGLTGGGRSRYCVQATLRSLHADERVTLWFGVVSRIPHATVPKSAEQILSAPILQDKKPLADPALGGSLDLLIGSCDIIKCVTGAAVYSKMAEISATPTLFGWSIVAPINSDQTQTVLKVRVSEDPLHEALQ